MWGTYGGVLTEEAFQSKLEQYPDALSGNEDFIRANWVGGRTTDCCGLIKGYGWLDAETQSFVYGSNGMPDITANQMVDDLVDELARDPAVAQCYAVWNEIRDELESYYKTTKREHLPLSQQKEFRAIKNLVIREADRLRSGELTYEESWSDGSYHDPGYAMYRKAKLLLQTAEKQEDVQIAINKMTEAAQLGSDRAQYTLGKMYFLGQQVEQDPDLGRFWLQQSAAQGNACAQQVLVHNDTPEHIPILLTTLRLFHHMSRIFRDQTLPRDSHKLIQMDSKRRQELQEKRLAAGHKIDDHEDPVWR